MTRDLSPALWPSSRLGEAFEVLAAQLGVAARSGETSVPPSAVAGDADEEQGRWIDAVAGWLGLEAEWVAAPYGTVEQLVCAAGPALLRVPTDGAPHFLLLTSRRRHRKVSVLGPDLRSHVVPAAAVRDALCRKVEASVLAETDRLLDDAGVPAARRARARAALLRERLSSTHIDGCWVFRLPPGASFWSQMRHVGLPRRLFWLTGVNTLEYALWILSWWILGQSVLVGRLDRDWLIAWALLLVSLIPFQLTGTWLQGVTSIAAGALLKRRLLTGALQMQPEEVRHQGAGQLLGRVIESQAVETLALSGGFLALVALVELVMAALVMGVASSGLPLLLVGWFALASFFGWRYYRWRRDWTDWRVMMTHDLVERMVGHRTRLAQESRERWHEGEDQALDRHLNLSAKLDVSAVTFMALVPRGWVVIALCGLAPAFVSGASPAALAVGLGGILLAQRALRRLAAGLQYVVGAALAWTAVAPLFHAAARPQVHGLPAFAFDGAASPAGGAGPVLAAHDLAFRYRDRGDPVLRRCSFEVSAGDRILLQGPSGGGKSTLASLLTGLRTSESGLLFLGGLDRQTLGTERWRHRVVACPQFHENHVFFGTFGFNLLMGQDWPPGPDDLERAEALCRELGLGDLLDKMPSGLLQLVGETGWQLSHGERSRLYIARALLQKPELLVLDESFGQLDSESLERAMRCVLQHSPTIIVIAHP